MAELMADLPDPCHDTGKTWVIDHIMHSSAMRSADTAHCFQLCHPAATALLADDRCPKWAAAGECEKNQGFMFDACMLSCKVGGWAGGRAGGLERV